MKRLKRLYFSLRNLLLYRDGRATVYDANPAAFVRDVKLAKPGGVDALKLVVTNAVLAAYGLRVVQYDNQLRGIYLTKAQREVVALVGQHGYKVGAS
jgi:hypothetical protein